MKAISGSGDLDYIIIGGGPAGIQLAYFLKKAGVSFRILERANEVGAFFRKFPRHGKLISVNKIHTGYSDQETNMRWDWNSLLSEEYAPLFKEFSTKYFPPAQALVDYLAKFVEDHEIDVELNTRVSTVERTSEGFDVTAADGRTWSAKRVVVATGVSREYIPQIPGIELCETYGTMSLDPNDFVNQRVLIIGKGNSAFETADHLVETTAAIHLASPRSLRFAWKTHFVGDLRAVNNNILDTYQLKIQNALLDGTIKNIRRDGSGLAVEIHYTHANGEVEELHYDRVLLCTGFGMDTSMFGDSCKPAMTACGRLPVQTSSWESENVKGLYFAGVLMQQRDYKKYMSAFIHGFRYNVQSLARHFLATYHGVSWPAKELIYSTKSIHQALVGAMNRSSAIWQQPGFLTYALTLDPSRRTAKLLEPMPMDYVADHYLSSGRILTLTLEYGDYSNVDPFSIERAHPSEVHRSGESSFLHPVVRSFEDGIQTGEHHLMEALSAEWREPRYVDPLYDFLQGTMVPTSMVIGPMETGDASELSLDRSVG